MSEFTLRSPATLPSDRDKEYNNNEICELSKDEMLDLDLNPDLEDVNDGMQEIMPLKTTGIGVKRQIDCSVEDIYDDNNNFQPIVDFCSPFVSTDKLENVENYRNRSIRRLSSSQQSKFINYCDEQLMAIQRKVVQNRGLNESQGYASLMDLTLDLKKLVDFIWFSIDGCPNTNQILEQNQIPTKDEYKGTQNTNFGQSHFLIRIADSFLDYIDKFPLNGQNKTEQHSTLSRVFKFLIILDKIFARMIEGIVPGKYKLSGTDKVRLTSIAERTRYRLPNIFENQGITRYHYELSKVYEETICKCG